MGKCRSVSDQLDLLAHGQAAARRQAIEHQEPLLLRIGIGHPGDAKKVSGFVLTKAPSSEQDLIDRAVDAAIDLSDDIIAGKLSLAMNKLNGFKAS